LKQDLAGFGTSFLLDTDKPESNSETG